MVELPSKYGHLDCIYSLYQFHCSKSNSSSSCLMIGRLPPAFINEHVNWPVSVDLIGTNIILRFFIFDALGSLNKAVFVTQYFSLPAVVPWPPVAVATLCHNCVGLARVYLCQCLESLSITLYAAIFLRFPFPELKCSRTFNNAVIIVLLFKLSLRQWWHMVGFLSSNMYIVTPHLMQTADRRIAQN